MKTAYRLILEQFHPRRAEGRCLEAGCRHRARFSPGVFRCFEVWKDAIDLTAFVRALLAVELGDTGLRNC
ncbi:DUF6420 family protein [Streptomyces sp. NPDC014892]|uniref:DUF6420 family protein n=1 Tax=Streptomyces gottesmaniae TaxID=3075518 RepID=A0ABU2YUW7_9ACTN|nr:DUF6420 family protein [Streptomyces sp. DSM 3412]